MEKRVCCTRVDTQGRELVEHGTALFPIAIYDDDLTATDVPWHWHDELEAVIVTEGAAVFATDRREVTLRAGDGCVINAGVLHGAWNSAAAEPCRLRSLVFHPRLIGGSAESVFWQKYLLPLTEDRALQLVPLRAEDGAAVPVLGQIAMAWDAGAQEPPGFEFTVREALSRVVLSLRETSVHGAEEAPSEKKQRDEQRIKTMLNHIRAHLAEEVTVAAIAASAAVSESECVRCFRATIHTTPIRYVRQLRLQRAAELLEETDRKITEIGGACGFQGMSYFSRAFRAQYGMAPSEYRAARRGEGTDEMV